MNVFDKFLKICDEVEPSWVGVILVVTTIVATVLLATKIVVFLMTTYPLHVAGVLFAAYILLWLYAINKVS